ncbi:MAG: hypothetical protein EP329_00430 [Deltaproteobacteria bacterium]|nr:MAG: hypothetical protein EP329_00430 [Deltaproteobacteria bacterium]
MAEIVLDGSASFDEDSVPPSTNDDIVSYVWSEGGTVLAEGPVVTVSFGPGLHEVALTVTDKLGLTGADMLLVEVIDAPPALLCEMLPACPEATDHNTVCHRDKTLYLGDAEAAMAHLDHGDAAGPCGGAYQVDAGRALVCHHGRTLEIAASAVPGHVRHGDTIGPCGAGCGEGEQLLRASWTLSGACDGTWSATGTVNGVAVPEGQLVDWTQTADGSSGAWQDGVLAVEAPKLALLVEAVSAEGEVVTCRWYPDGFVDACVDEQQGAVAACLEGCVAPPPPECHVCTELNAQIFAQCIALGLSVEACEALHATLGDSCDEIFCAAEPPDCALACEELGVRASAICDQDPAAFEPVGCGDGGQLVSQLCQAQVCGTEPSCEDVCMQQSDASREQCLASGQPLEDCDWRWQDEYQTCLQVQCQQPVPCEQTCFDELQNEVMACILGPEDAPECQVVRSCLEQCGGCPSGCNVEAIRAFAPCLEQGLDPLECQPEAEAAFIACVERCGGGPVCWPECVSGDGWCPASCSEACDSDCQPVDPCDPAQCAPGDGVCNDFCDPACDSDCVPFDPCEPQLCSPFDGVCMDPRCDPACDLDCGGLDPCDPLRCMPGDGVCGERCDPACDDDCGMVYCDPQFCVSGDGWCLPGCDATCDYDCAGPVECDPALCLPGDGICEPGCDPACDPECGIAYCDPAWCVPGDGVCDPSLCGTCDDDCFVPWCDPAVCVSGDGICDLSWCDGACDLDCGMGHCDPVVCDSGDGICDLGWCDETCDADCRIAWCDPEWCRPDDGICDYVWCDETCDPDCGVDRCSPIVCISGDGICDPGACDASCDLDCGATYCSPEVCLPGDGVCDLAWCDAGCDPDCAPLGECEITCEKTVDPVRQLCYGLVGDPALCDLVAGAAVEQCVAVLCGGQADPCDGGCGTFASSLVDFCLSAFDPNLCDLAFTALTDSCVQAFACGTAPTCEQQCEVAAEEARMACEAQGMDPMACEQVWQATLEPCLMACYPPPPSCEAQCMADGDALFDRCMTPDDLDF